MITTKNVQDEQGSSLQRIGCQYFSSLALTLCSDDIGFRGKSKTKETQQWVSTLLNTYRIPQTVPLFKILWLQWTSGHIIPFCCKIFNITDFSKSTTESPYWKSLSENYGQWYMYSNRHQECQEMWPLSHNWRISLSYSDTHCSLLVV